MTADIPPAKETPLDPQIAARQPDEIFTTLSDDQRKQPEPLSLDRLSRPASTLRAPGRRERSWWSMPGNFRPKAKTVMPACLEAYERAGNGLSFMVTAASGLPETARAGYPGGPHRCLRELRGLSGLRHRRHGNHVHGNAQDQFGQILKGGKLVVYGDVGQTFMYGAKGGEVYVMGNAAGRPLINAVGGREWSSTAPPWTIWPNPSWPETPITAEDLSFSTV